MSVLYELVKESKENNQALQAVIDLFEPKIKKSLYLTDHKEKEDLAQELKCKLIRSIRTYDMDSTPGFWELKEHIQQYHKNSV
ncbi:helix-turn-helix domain-containing protein [Bacillus xiapuensis]|uniref:helix-turn-helix domain-containing protein n=1 Tax=Bacillus xiapuensis TaxID=2014075 RepID=UPI000C23C947|nr:helix-turn-helix domain-containing protein [Bacillus xiapuensis]